jgi:alkanesulfonate monooxygenase SsuD/methylene tetrahydromethanopterin reductase-like flavin-dependent oxidoreductase (luciferase family)
VPPPENPDANFDGRYWQVEGLDRLPPPVSARGPRLWLADHAPHALVRVAERYDGWLPCLPNAQAYGEAWRRIRALAESANRPGDAVVPGLYATVTINPDRDRARQELEEHVLHNHGRPLADVSAVQAVYSGTAEECAEWLASYVQAGARHIVIRIGAPDPGSRLKELAAAVRTVA